MGVPDIRHLLGQELAVTLGDLTTTLEVVDWAGLRADSEALAARARGLGQDEINALYQGARDPVAEIVEYFLFEYAERVEDGDWLPFGLLGIGCGPESYTEMTNDGALVFDLAAEAAVLWVRDDEVTPVGHLEDLPITRD
ncbi:hypothetical protein [Hamadaea tsunoensis]|uniref:hypothetical protein n=1 Tax=Hamadaea tsunoensis TaxID=53368 RepID=UPI00041104AE|nr:hypothetical protein [Hamadaea tsunoensis]